MMNVLLLADLHGQYGLMDSFLDLQPDAVFIAGDITNMGPVSDVETLFPRIDVPCFAVPGNCDPKEILDALDQSECVSLHGSQMNLGKMTLVGVGGSNPTPFNTPFELTDKQIDDLLHVPMRKMEKAIHNVLITHAPPLGVLDSINGNNTGSASIRRHSSSFDLVCCAHIHENRGVVVEDGITFVNPGPGAMGNCAMIHFGDEAKDIKVELLTV
jgi:Icc-related predicted phosphoesterase